MVSCIGPVLSSGSRDSSVIQHDVRIADHKVGTLNGHTQEVCGLKWSSAGTLLASGGNDNLLNLWDDRCALSPPPPAAPCHAYRIASGGTHPSHARPPATCVRTPAAPPTTRRRATGLGAAVVPARQGTRVVAWLLT